MTIIKDQSIIYDETLRTLPFDIIRQLTILECAKLILEEAKKESKYCHESASGMTQSAEKILERLIDDHIYDLVNFGRLQGINLKKELFKPLDNYILNEKQYIVYTARLLTLEHQLRSLMDSDKVSPNIYIKD